MKKNIEITYSETYGAYVGKLYENISDDKKEEFIKGLEESYAQIVAIAEKDGKEPPPRSILSDLMPKDDKVLKQLADELAKKFSPKKENG